MKKFVLLLCMSLTMFYSYAQNPTTDKVLTGVGTEVTAIHADTKSAVSTLHEDASKIVETVYTDSKSLLSVAYDDVNKLVKYAAPKLEAGLITLAQTLKVTVAEVYEAMIRKQIAVAIADACYGVLGLFFLFLVYKIFMLPEDKLTTLNDYAETRWKAKWIVAGAGLGLFSLIFIGMFVGHLQEMILGFFAPKYGAIKEIVEIVNTLIK